MCFDDLEGAEEELWEPLPCEELWEEPPWEEPPWEEPEGDAGRATAWLGALGAAPREGLIGIRIDGLGDGLRPTGLSREGGDSWGDGERCEGLL